MAPGFSSRSAIVIANTSCRANNRSETSDRSAIIYLESTSSTLQRLSGFRIGNGNGLKREAIMQVMMNDADCGPSIWYFLQSKGSEELEFLSTVIAAKTIKVVFF